MTGPLSYPERETAVFGYLAAAGLRGIAEPSATRPRDFINPLHGALWEAALYLHGKGRTANALNLIEIIDADRGHKHIVESALAEIGVPDLFTYLSGIDSSLSFNPAGGEVVTEYLADISEAAGRRRAAEIGKQLSEGGIEVEVAVKELEGVKSAGAAQHIEPLLNARQINLAKKPTEPPVVFKLAGHKISTAGNLTVIAAQAKAGKTAAVGAMLARVFAEQDSDGDFLGFDASPPGGKAVVLFDTEQSPFDAWRVMSRTMSRAGMEKQPANLRAYYLLDLSIQERRRALLAELKRAERICGGIHSIIIDGVADLVMSVNDEAEAIAFVSELVSLAVHYFCPVVCILHENPAQPGFAGKTRGHLGSQLERKAESNLRVKKDAEGVSVIYSERGCRHAEIPEPTAPRFKFCDKAGMHISCEPAGVAKAEAMREEMAQEVREIFNTPESIMGFSWADLHKRLEDIHGIKRSGARKRFEKLRAAGFLKQNMEGLYTR